MVQCSWREKDKGQGDTAPYKRPKKTARFVFRRGLAEVVSVSQVAVVRPATAGRTSTASSPGMIKAWEWVWLSESLTCTQMFTLCQTPNRFQRSVSDNTTQRLGHIGYPEKQVQLPNLMRTIMYRWRSQHAPIDAFYMYLELWAALNEVY